jgi:hypothetical protein
MFLCCDLESRLGERINLSEEEEFEKLFPAASFDESPVRLTL